MKTIAERLKNARALKGWTQCELADAAGLSQGAIGNIETGFRKAKASLIAISAALKVNYKWLVTGEGTMRGEDSGKENAPTSNGANLPKYNDPLIDRAVELLEGMDSAERQQCVFFLQGVAMNSKKKDRL